MLKKSLIILALIASGLAIYFYIGPKFLWPDSIVEKKIDKLYTNSKVELLDPEIAPPDIRPTIMYGRQLLKDTKKYLPQNVGNKLSCNNCHFAGGNSLGGPINGIPLVGVVKRYPVKKPGEKDFTLEDRINGCFMRSMNGKPIPEDGKEMKAMVAYMHWISDAVKNKDVPWLGLPVLDSKHVPDPKNGEKLFALHCAICHGDDGQGQPRNAELSYPPLWGQQSFNDAAGMNKMVMLSSFIYCNMPYQDPFLTLEEAIDIASFIIQQPRPILKR